MTKPIPINIHAGLPAYFNRLQSQYLNIPIPYFATILDPINIMAQLGDKYQNIIKEETAIYFSLEEDGYENGVIMKSSEEGSTDDRGVTTVTDEFNGDTIETDFILTNSGVKNVRNITVDAATLIYGKDYNLSENDTGITTVAFTVAPATGTNNIDIQYDHGSTDKIFDDFPQDFLTIKTFPRIGFDIIISPTKEIALSGAAFQSNKIVQVNVYSADTGEVEDFIDTIRQIILNNGDSLHYWNFITPDNIGPTLPSDVKGGKIFQRNIDLRAEFEFEGTY